MPKLPRYVIVKDGDWYVRIFRPTNRTYANGKRIYQQFKRKCEPKTPERAQEILAFLRNEINAPKIAPSTVGEFLTDFLETKKHGIRQRTFEHYQDVYNRHIKDTLGHTQMADLSPMLIQRFYNSILSPDARRRVHTLLSMAFKYAVLWKQIPENPCSHAIVGKVKKKESRAMTESQAKRFLEACRTDDRYIIFEFALETGLRPQECLALSWDDVDLPNRRISVRNALTEGLKGGKLVIGEPKTESSKRTIGITEHLRDRLIRQKAIQDKFLRELKRSPVDLRHKNARQGVNYAKRLKHREAARERVQNFERYNLVFPSDTGGPRSRTNLNRRMFKEVMDKAGLKGFSVKHLRHTCASIMANYVNPKRLQEHLGHRDVKSTLKFYTHVHDADKADFADKISSVLYDSVVK